MACRSTRLFLALAIVLVLSFKTTAFAQQSTDTSDRSASVPRLVALGGMLRDGKGQPLSGVVGLTFSIFKDQQGGAPLWTENQNVQLDESGQYSVLLGASQTGSFTGGGDAWNARIAPWAAVTPRVVRFRPAAPQVRAVSAGSNRPGALRRSRTRLHSQLDFDPEV